MEVKFINNNYTLTINQKELEAMLDCLFDGCGENLDNNTDEERLIAEMVDQLHNALMEQIINKERMRD